MSRAKPAADRGIERRTERCEYERSPLLRLLCACGFTASAAGRERTTLGQSQRPDPARQRQDPARKSPGGAGGSADRAPTSRPHSFACATEPEGGDQGLGCGVLQSLSSAEPWPGMRHCVAPPRPGPDPPPYLWRSLRWSPQCAPLARYGSLGQTGAGPQHDTAL
jgi:hypothetical protein